MSKRTMDPWVWLALLLAAGFATATPADEDDEHSHRMHYSIMADFERELERDHAEEPGALGTSACSGGFAGGFPCQKVDLVTFLPNSSIGGGNGNDCWGWTDPLTGREYALHGRSNGLSFVDVTEPAAPVYLGTLPPHGSNSLWRDIKVHADHAFVVSQANGHGMQIFDLKQLRDVANPPVVFSETAHYDEFGSAHNLAVNEDTGYAYAVGTSTCSGGLHMIDVRKPILPTFAGCFSGDGYTHDAQCVIYHGQHTKYVGKEICVA